MPDVFSNVMIYLVGPPGVGKFTIGSILAEKMPAKLVDNHYWLNPIFGLVQQDGKTPLPDGVWLQADRVRRAVFEAMAELSPKDWNFVVTHAAVGDETDRSIAKEVLAVAQKREAKLLVVRLGCSPDALAIRVASPERHARMKETDVEAARLNASKSLFDPGHANTITLDTTGLTAREAAERIMQRVG